jgi:hypothetical protein
MSRGLPALRLYPQDLGGASMTTTIVLFVVLALVFLAAMHEEGAI